MLIRRALRRVVERTWPLGSMHTRGAEKSTPSTGTCMQRGRSSACKEGGHQHARRDAEHGHLVCAVPTAAASAAAAAAVVSAPRHDALLQPVDRSGAAAGAAGREGGRCIGAEARVREGSLSELAVLGEARLQPDLSAGRGGEGCMHACCAEK